MLISRRHMILGLAASGACLTLPAVASSQALTGKAFGGTWRLVIENAKRASTARAVVERVVAEIDAEMSPYKSNSALSLFNAMQTTDWQPMPPTICTVAIEALRVAALSDGAFDPTVGPIVSRFGFGPIKGSLGRYEDIDVGKRQIRKLRHNLTLDFCGIAKGYALDRVAGELIRLGCENATIEIGGEVLTLGTHPTGRPWQIGISDPMSTDFAIRRIVEPGPLALATSGHVANGILGPISTSHIIDPGLGKPTKTSLASVSVLAASAMEADALATALCAAGTDAGVTLAKRLGVSAFFITDGTEAPEEIMTNNFARHIVA